MKYTYYSSDTFTGEGDFDITGDHYQELLNLCFQYSAVMSFLIYDSNASYLKDLENSKLKDRKILRDLSKNIGRQENLYSPIISIIKYVRS